MVPTRRILDPIFGQLVLRAANNGRALWTKVNTLSQWQKGIGWQANLYGGVQSANDDWAAMFVPVSELRVTDFNSALWSYYMTAAQTFGVNLVIWVHDPNDFSKRAEITQLGNVAGLGKAEGWNSHNLDKTVDQFFFYGEGTTGTGLTAGPPNYYGWDDFQADVLLKTWTIYRISLEYGWEASGTFDHVWVVELKINGTQLPIRPGVEEQLDLIREAVVLIASLSLNVIEHHTGDDTLTKEESGSTHTNLGAGAAITLTLPQDALAGCRFRFAVMTDAQELRIDPGAAGAIYIGGAKQTDDMYISADAIAESVELVADGNGDWVALSAVGTWSVETP